MPPLFGYWQSVLNEKNGLIQTLMEQNRALEQANKSLKRNWKSMKKQRDGYKAQLRHTLQNARAVK